MSVRCSGIALFDNDILCLFGITFTGQGDSKRVVKCKRSCSHCSWFWRCGSVGKVRRSVGSLLWVAAANKSLQRIFGDQGPIGRCRVLDADCVDVSHRVNSKPLSSALAAHGEGETW